MFEAKHKYINPEFFLVLNKRLVVHALRFVHVSNIVITCSKSEWSSPCRAMALSKAISCMCSALQGRALTRSTKIPSCWHIDHIFLSTALSVPPPPYPASMPLLPLARQDWTTCRTPHSRARATTAPACRDTLALRARV